MAKNKTSGGSSRLDKVVAEAQQAKAERELGYRDRALKMYPWICGRCSREFTRANVQELTVHHRDHNHDNNPLDGSNWELLCVYCHDNEHARLIDAQGSGATKADNGSTSGAAHRPFEGLADLLKNKK